MDDLNTQSMYDAVAREVERESYPADFPVLPEIPAGRYVEQSFHDLEIEHVWKKTWLSAAHVSELPNPGSYKLFERLGLSIIVSRGTDGEIRAFHNVCRHRGAALVSEPTGTARLFVCPYHAWSFASDGRLVSVPEERNFGCLDKAARALYPVRCETWHGFVFINLDENAGPLADFLAPTSQQVADFPLDDMIVKDTITVELGCNWKTAYDNFLEIYHVNVVHAKSLAPYLDSRSFTVSLLPNGHARFATRKRAGQSLFSDGVEQPDDFTARFREHAVGLPFFPNGFTVLDPVGFAWQTFWPAGPDRMVMVVTLMGWKRDDEEDRAFWTRMRASQIDVLNEDIFLFPGIQRAMRTGVLKGVLAGVQEQHIYWYNEEIDRRIGIDNIPPHLRVQQVLRPCAAG